MIEIDSSPELQFDLTRRQLLASLGGGILVLVASPALALSGPQRRPEVPQQISAWIHVGPNGTITVLTGKVEVGQNARTSLTQAASEELRVPVSHVIVTMGDTDLVPFDMGTFGSRTTPTMVPQIRRAAAAAREALLDIAAKDWGVNRTALTADSGMVSETGKPRTASYGDLAKRAAIVETIDPNVRLTPSSDWKVLGTSVPKIGGREFVTGKHAYTIDLARPGMLHAKVLRAPSFGATLVSLDAKAAEAMPGVRVVHDGEFVGVAAPTRRLAEKALAALVAEWKETPQPSSEAFFADLTKQAAALTDATPDSAAKRLRATYTAQYIAHTPLEPRAALAEWDGAKMTVHTGTQRPFGVKGEIVDALGLSEKQVRVLVPDTGSGYGGKHSGDAAVEAARVAKAIGKPIKLVWTRVEEFTHAYFRPGGVVEVASGIDSGGKLASWQFDNFNSGGSGIATPYDVPNPHAETHEAKSPLRQGSYRGLAATFNHFARESHMDELAHLAGEDPLASRLKNLNNAQLQAVLVAATDRFGWGKQKAAPGHGFGLACGTEKGSCIATVVEVSVDPNSKAVRVVRAVNAFECGAILNPDHLKNQVEGAVLMGLGGSLSEAIEFDNGRILNPHLAHYRVPHYPDVPAMETILLDRKDLPSAGAGETPIMAVAPAIGNAIYAATGIRLRAMPMKLPQSG